ncbi:hypothetical protein [Elioraea rosea]|uniref:hypothetical protein n=1 Tax=Elioraea rosea TaxID=2492390 RepID=UPI001182CCF0|nr:hypothetical protein [Elioraea rosea]
MRMIEEESEEARTQTLRALHDSAEISQPETVPWIRVGNLYLSVTATGNLSWPPVVGHLEPLGHTTFHVFSGRHGSAAGGFGLDSKVPQGVIDATHFGQDQDVAHYMRTGEKRGYCRNDWPNTRLHQQNTKLTIENFGEGSTRDKVKAAAKAYLDKGDTVIFAWCYSIGAMHLYNTEKLELENTSYETLFRKTPATVIKEKYDWVKRFINQRYH